MMADKCMLLCWMSVCLCWCTCVCVWLAIRHRAINSAGYYWHTFSISRGGSDRGTFITLVLAGLWHRGWLCRHIELERKAYLLGRVRSTLIRKDRDTHITYSMPGIVRAIHIAFLVREETRAGQRNRVNGGWVDRISRNICVLCGACTNTSKHIYTHLLLPKYYLGRI